MNIITKLLARYKERRDKKSIRKATYTTGILSVKGKTTWEQSFDGTADIIDK